MTWRTLLPPGQVNELKESQTGPVLWPDKFLSAPSTILAPASLINAGVCQALFAELEDRYEGGV